MADANDDLRALARSHTKTAIEALVSVMQETQAPAATRVAAAQALLDRGWGRSVARGDASDSAEADGHEQRLLELD